jgi:predicted transcriptional regulator
MRSRGYSYTDIAKALGISRSTAHKYVTAELDKLRAETRASAAQIRSLELARLDRLWRRAEEMLADGDADGAKAIAAAIRIMERRARLLGLDEQGAEVTGAVVLTVEVPSPVKAGEG